MFRHWLTLALIKPLWYVLSFTCICWGLNLIVTNVPGETTEAMPGGGTITSYHGNAAASWLGVAFSLLGPLCLRIVCEVIAAIVLVGEAAMKNRGK